MRREKLHDSQDDHMCHQQAFNREYFCRKETTGYTLEFQHKRFRRYIKLLFREEIPADLRILDMGCGFGVFLGLCDKLHFKTYGVDISKYSMEKAKKFTAGNLLISDSHRLPFKSLSFNVVTMFDMIEHLKSPYEALKEANRILKLDGLLVITTPNLESLSKLIQGRRWLAYQDATHLFLFTKYTLKKLVEKTGFKIARLETVSSLPVLGSLLRKIGLAGNIWLAGRKQRHKSK